VDLVMPRPLPIDPPTELSRLREEQPIVRVHCPRGFDAWLVTRYADVRWILADEQNFSAVDAPFAHLYDDWELGSNPPPGDMLRMDGERHARLRGRLAGQFTVRRIRSLRSRIEQVVDDRIDALADMQQPVDINRHFAALIPTLVMTELLGIPEEDRESFDQYTRFVNDYTATPAQRAWAHGSMRRYIAGRVELEKSVRGDNYLGELVGSNDGDDPLSDEELAILGETLLVAGAETTGNNIALALIALLRNPDQTAELIRRPELLETAVEELLRYLSIIQYGVLRRAVRTVSVAGQVVQPGEYLVASIPAANHDPELVPDPARLNLERGERVRHVAFGHGVHQCLGQHLARLELQVAVSAVLRRIPTIRLAEPLERVPFKHEMSIYGVHALPMRWDHVLPAAGSQGTSE
jgi:cytochrome P450